MQRNVRITYMYSMKYWGLFSIKYNSGERLLHGKRFLCLIEDYILIFIFVPFAKTKVSVLMLSLPWLSNINQIKMCYFRQIEKNKYLMKICFVFNYQALKQMFTEGTLHMSLIAHRNHNNTDKKLWKIEIYCLTMPFF